jgi:hypothetical protein
MVVEGREAPAALFPFSLGMQALIAASRGAHRRFVRMVGSEPHRPGV